MNSYLFNLKRGKIELDDVVAQFGFYRIHLQTDNERDIQKLRTFVPSESAELHANWDARCLVFSGPDSQLRLVFRTQVTADVQRLEQILPPDQRATFVGEWSEGGLMVRKVNSPRAGIPGIAGDGGEDGAAVSAQEAEFLRVGKMKTRELKTLAAERGVEWDTKASLETMKERIAAAAFNAGDDRGDDDDPEDPAGDGNDGTASE